MKKVIISTLLICFSLSIYAERNLVRIEDVRAFLKTTTYVVLEDNPTAAYNSKFKRQLKNHGQLLHINSLPAKSSKRFEAILTNHFWYLSK